MFSPTGKLLILWIMFGYGVAMATPEIDSLRKIQMVLLEKGEQKELMSTYFALGKAYLGAENHDSAYVYFQECLGYARSLGDRKLAFNSLMEMGKLDSYPGNNPTFSIKHLLQAGEIGEGSITESEQRQLYHELGNSYLLDNDFKMAMDYHIKSVRLAESSQDQEYLATALQSLGSLYWQIGQFSSSLETYRKSYQLSKNGTGPHFTILSSMSIAHFSLHDLDSALYYVRLARKDAVLYKQAYGETYSLGLIGNIKLEQGNYAQAIDSLERSVELCEQYNFSRDANSFRVDLAKAYSHIGKYDKALAVLKQAEIQSQEMKYLGLLSNNYEVRSQVYALSGDSANAFLYLKRFYSLKDSMMDEEVLSDMASIEKGYEIDKREDTILAQQAKLEASERRLYVYGFASGIVFLLIILYMAYVRNKALREINQLLEDKNGEIRRQNDRLASSNEDLRQFAHVTSHDLREPLRNISSFSSLLGRRYIGQLDKNADEYLTFIIDGVKRMDRLLNDLLTYSVVGVFDHEYSQVDIGKTIGDVMRRFQQNKTLQGARIQLHKLPTIRANAQQMDQLFAQLIDNAIKFRSSDKPEIDIRAELKDDGYIFSVKDNGIGMDKAYKDKIFALFLRLHNQQSAYEGSGIGLSIVKKIVEQHEGRIWIESELGQGTTVYFFLPTDPPIDTTPLHVKDRWQWLQPSVPTDQEIKIEAEGMSS